MGDDLTELILQYLTFEDKVRLECVSKQWRRLVFNKQFVIELNRNVHNVNPNKKTITFMDKLFGRVETKRQFNVKDLKILLNKCPNIMKVNIKIEVEREVLSLIGRYCPLIKSFTLDNNSSEIYGFLRMCDHKLEELVIVENPYKVIEHKKDYLRLCPNLKNVKVSDPNGSYE